MSHKFTVLVRAEVDVEDQVWAMVSDSGTAMYETVLTDEEYADDDRRRKTERDGLAAIDCTEVRWRRLDASTFESLSDPT